MQALGAYAGDKMLFLGLGTGLGSALVADRVIVGLELGSLPFDSKHTMAERLGDEARQRDGNAAWQRHVARAAEILRPAMAADYITLGGGNAAAVDPLPPKVRRGHNDDAFTGGMRLWQEPVELHRDDDRCVWRVVG
jgi:polyphosphate glucokinase